MSLSEKGARRRRRRAETGRQQGPGGPRAVGGGPGPGALNFGEGALARVRHRPRRAVGPQETKLLNKLTSVMLQYTTGMHESKQSNKRSFFSAPPPPCVNVASLLSRRL